ncbi:MAG: transporter [Desulfobaccales bacterium]
MEISGVKSKGFMGRGLILSLMAMLVLGGLGTGLASPAQAQIAGPPIMGQPTPPPEEKKGETAPTTCGPVISDTCMPISTGKFAMQVWTAMSFYPNALNRDWEKVDPGGKFRTFYMPVKFTYGPMKDMEVYVIIPFITNWAYDVKARGPNGENSASYSGIGDMTAIVKYNLLPETDWRPAVSGVAGFASIPTGHASLLNPAFLGQDAIGTGALTFTTGVNLYKWLKPFLLYSNIWLNSPVNLFKIGSDPTRNVRSREYVTFNVAAEVPLFWKFVGLLEMYSTWTWNNLHTIQGYQTPQTVIGLLPALEFIATDKLSLAAGCSFDLAGKNGVQKFTPMLTALYYF